MVTQKMVHTHEGKKVISEIKIKLLIKKTDIAPYVRTYVWVTI